MSANQVSSNCFEPCAEISAEIEVHRSRFIGTLRKVLSPQEARAAVLAERELYPDARHLVFAFLVGPPASETAGMSDDGEPKGTAGRPVLEVLRGSGLRNALVTVRRYFGGVKLGTGGLVRAYSACCKKVLEDAPRVPLRTEKPYRISVPYTYFESVKRSLSLRGCRVAEEDFAERASFTLLIAEDEQGVLDSLRDITRGDVTIEA